MDSRFLDPVYNSVDLIFGLDTWKNLKHWLAMWFDLDRHIIQNMDNRARHPFS